MIDPNGLLDLAHELAGTGRGRPREANLRRGVSSAYYALFHELTDAVVEHVMPSAPVAEKRHMRRAWTHRELKEAADLVSARAQVLTQNPAAPLTKDAEKAGPLLDLAASDVRLVELAELFISLQEQRHAADYDHQQPPDKASLLSACQDAETARRRLGEAQPAAREAFLTLLLLRRTDLRLR